MPKVLEEYKRDGGYLVTFINDKKVNKSVFCFVHKAGSPYKLLNLNATKSVIKPSASFINKAFLFSADQLKINPDPNPKYITPNQGIGG